MFKKPNKIQYVDSRCNLILPWYTKPCLDDLLTMNYKEWNVFEWGGGCSTVWYAYNCKHVDTIENSISWATEITKYLQSQNKTNYSMKIVEVPASANTPHPNMEMYLGYISTLNKKWDCIVIDGAYRNDALLISEKFINPGGIIIFDNYEQWTSGYTILPNKEYMNSKYKENVFLQSKGSDWKTAYWKIE